MPIFLLCLNAANFEHGRLTAIASTTRAKVT